MSQCAARIVDAGQRHVRDLAAAIKKSHTKTLDPVTIWWDGRAWACIDGHHRLDAYRAATAGMDHAIPVEVFKGTLEQAMGRAASANTKDKLVMSPAAKSNAAWRLVAATSMSKAETAEASGISESTVATMRRVHAKLAAQAAPVDDFGSPQGADLRDLSWAEAKALAAGVDAPGFDQDAANEKKAQAMALALRKALGKEGGRYPEILARALDIYDTRLARQLMDYWRDSEADEDAENVEAECSDF